MTLIDKKNIKLIAVCHSVDLEKEELKKQFKNQLLFHPYGSTPSKEPLKIFLRSLYQKAPFVYELIILLTVV
ncbi:MULTISPECIES: hypothetical protein [unclassified Psychrobacillus]|uniref:hypothetical protein n=1 Tax=unclassified Psychrobacillus TaxID=2636677 RepID=UPI0030FB476E